MRDPRITSEMRALARSITQGERITLKCPVKLAGPEYKFLILHEPFKDGLVKGTRVHVFRLRQNGEEIIIARKSGPSKNARAVVKFGNSLALYLGKVKGDLCALFSEATVILAPRSSMALILLFSFERLSSH